MTLSAYVKSQPFIQRRFPPNEVRTDDVNCIITAITTIARLTTTAASLLHLPTCDGETHSKSLLSTTIAPSKSYRSLPWKRMVFFGRRRLSVCDRDGDHLGNSLPATHDSIYPCCHQLYISLKRRSVFVCLLLLTQQQQPPVHFSGKRLPPSPPPQEFPDTHIG